MFIYLLCLSAALLCYTGFQNQSLISLIRSIFSPCSTCCFGLGFSTTKPTCRNTSKDLGHNSRTSFLVPPSLALPRGVVLAVACRCTPFPARVPRSAAGYPPSSLCVATFFTLSSTVRWSALLPGVHFSLPHLRRVVCFGFFLCLLPRFVGTLLPLFLDPVRQREGGGVGCCGVDGLDDDMRTLFAVVAVCVAGAAVSPIVACVCVAVWWLFSILLVRRWRPMRAWRARALVVWSLGQRVRCCCRCLWAPGIPLALLVCAFLFAVACTHTIHSSFSGVGGLFLRRLLLAASVCLLGTCALRGVGGTWVAVPLCLRARAGRCVAYSFPPLLYSVPSLVSGALLACSRSCGSFVGGGLRRSCSPYLVACGPVRAFVHVLSSPASFSLPATSYLFASSRRLSGVRIRLHCIPCFASGGLYACV